MPYYINERAKTSKAFTIDIRAKIFAHIISKKYGFSVQLNLESKNYKVTCTKSYTPTSADINKALEFAKKNIIQGVEVSVTLPPVQNYDGSDIAYSKAVISTLARAQFGYIKK